MEIVRCDMCFDIYALKEWKESDVFICKICAEILSKIKKKEIEFGREYSEKSRLKLFKSLRGIKLEKK